MYRGPLIEGEWLVAAARTPAGELIWTAGFYGGSSPAQCGPVMFIELAFSAALTEKFAGAALVDMNGRLVGMLVRCGGRLAAMPADEVSRARLVLAPPEEILEKEYNVRLEPMTDALRAHFGGVTGDYIVERAGSAGQLLPGDIVTVEEGRLLVQRGKRTITIDTAADKQRYRGMDLDQRLRVVNVASGSPAAAAGIEAGDLIVSAGASQETRRAAILKLLAAAEPVYVVWQHGDIRRGALLQ
jgi:S1-C subfamily serine protease